LDASSQPSTQEVRGAGWRDAEVLPRTPPCNDGGGVEGILTDEIQIQIDSVEREAASDLELAQDR
jgi:hypothetical protein